MSIYWSQQRRKTCGGAESPANGAPSVAQNHKPTALIVMARDVFDAQFDAAHLERLRTIVELPEPAFTDTLDDPGLASRLADVEVILTGWGVPQLNSERLDRMPRLAAMVHCAGSVRAQVTDEFWRRGIVAASVAEANAVPVAEFTLAAVIFAGKKVPFIAADADVRRAHGLHIDRYGELGNLRRTIGVVGFSRVGRRVVQLLQQLDDLDCLVADPFADPDAVAAAGGRLVTLEEMLPVVDVLSLHAPALPSTRHMIGAEQLAQLRDHVTLVNTARGALVDTDALRRECLAGRLNAMLDVTDPEPLPADDPLFDLPNVMVTPHLAGSLGNEMNRMTDAALDEVARFAAGIPFDDPVTAAALQLSA